MTARLGIIAGGGDLPARLIDACRAGKRDFYVLALEDQADATLTEGVAHDWVRLGAGGEALRLLRAADVRDLVFAGRVHRPSLGAMRPDRVTAGFLAEAGLRALGDDSLLRSIVARVEREGFRVLSPASLLAEMLAQQGAIGRLDPGDAAACDIARGIEVARFLGAADVGQAVIVQQGIVLAVEAAEGTDAMIARAGLLRRDGPGGTLVKISKPQQDRRVDLPVIGPETVRQGAAAGLAGIAVEAGRTFILDREGVAASADAAGMFVVGVTVSPQT